MGNANAGWTRSYMSKKVKKTIKGKDKKPADLKVEVEASARPNISGMVVQKLIMLKKL